jgi:hypothetical protein
MILLWLLCVSLVLGGLLAGLRRWWTWSKTRLQPVPVRRPAVVRRRRGRSVASGLYGRSLSPPDGEDRPPGRSLG